MTPIRSLLFTALIIVAGLIVTQCTNPFQSSKLPKGMPERTVMRYNETGGMRRARRDIVISGFYISYEVLKDADKDPAKWTVNISPEDKQQLYKVFVDNSFDLITNDNRNGETTDAGSEGVGITVNADTYHKSFGANSPMSGKSAEQYKTVSQALLALAAKYENSRDRVPENYASLEYTSEMYPWPAGHVTAAALKDEDIPVISELIQQAVRDYNRKDLDHNLKVEKYRFQYVSVVNDNKQRVVWVNSFCEDHGEDWRKVIVTAKEGGNCYFNLMINLDKKNYTDFQINGTG